MIGSRARGWFWTAMAGVAAVLPGRPGHAGDPSALWNIVHGQCVPNELQEHDPAPCVAVDFLDGVRHGSAVLKDRVGQTQFLLIPTARLAGIESPALLEPDAANYWQAAWDARKYVEERAPGPLPREDIGLAINSAYARSQDQLHIHVECLRPDVRDALRDQQARVGDGWSPIRLVGQAFRVRRIEQAELGAVNPFKLVAGEVSSDGGAMAAETVAVLGASFADGGSGFWIVAGRVGLDNRGHAEDLLDHGCMAARQAPRAG